jgi:thiamine biosynthesis lipoprotein
MLPNRIKEKREITQDRRDFLKFVGALGILAAPMALLPWSREKIFDQGLTQASKTRPLMGTFVTVTVLDRSPERATEAMEAAFAEINRLVGLLDRHSSGTPVAYLNQTGYLRDLPPELYEVLEAGKRMHHLTRGVFDMTVMPLLDLFEKSFARTALPPPAAAIENGRKLVGDRYVHLRRKEVRLEKDGMGITLDGIAKGYIVDRAIGVLEARGVKQALINAGGDIRALGDKGNGSPWRIAIQDPADKKRVVQVIPLKNWAIATSGNYENYFDRDKNYHHILDPETGLSARNFAGVTVMAPTLAVADALATAAFVPAFEKARDFIGAASPAEALWIDRRRTLSKTGGWQWG